MSLSRYFSAVAIILNMACAAFNAQASEEPLPPDQAFRMNVRALDDAHVEIAFEIAKGYYLYRDKFRFSVSAPADGVGNPVYPAGEAHTDAFFGTQTIFRDRLTVRLPVSAPLGQNFTLTVTHQGCADIGVCYPPSKVPVSLHLVGMSAIPQSDQSNATNPLASLGIGSPQPQQDQPLRTAAPDPAPSLGDESSRIAGLLAGGSLMLIAVSFLGFGLLLAFTPCVLPMVPILSAIIVRQGHARSRSRALLLITAYVLGMAATYTIAGIAAGLAGAQLAVMLQTPWVLGLFALLLVALALGMFGLYDIQLASSAQGRLSAFITRLGGSLHGIAAMGAVSALIVGPCVTAPLAGAVLFVAQSGDAVLGGLAFFCLALGMGLPLFAVGLGAHWLHGGPWMEQVKRFFGVLLLATAIWIASPVLPPLAVMLLWAALLLVWALLLIGLRGSGKGGPLSRVFGVLSLAAATVLVAGAISGSRDPLDPFAGLRGQPANTHPVFERVSSLQELDARLATAGQPVMLDFYADWCVSCKEMERFTFSDPDVARRMQQFVLLQVDVTRNTEDEQALLRRFRLIGPPGILFFDAEGRERDGLRVIGYMKAERFAQVLDQAVQ